MVVAKGIRYWRWAHFFCAIGALHFTSRAQVAFADQQESRAAKPVALPTGFASEMAGPRRAVPAKRDGAVITIPAGRFRPGLSDPSWNAVRLACEAEISPIYSGLFCAPGQATLHDQERQPARAIAVAKFRIAKQEASVGEYLACVRAGKCLEIALLRMGNPSPKQPVSYLTYRDAADFCAFSGGRLPTEIEWEWAARVGAPRSMRIELGAILGGDSANHGAIRPADPLLPGSVPLRVTDESDGARGATDVGTFVHDKTPSGLRDMAGNLSEWTAGRYRSLAEYEVASAPLEEPWVGDAAAVRGGSFLSPRFRTRVTAREAVGYSAREQWIGVRCAYDVLPIVVEPKRK